jgi:MSHA biogenesis protein MshL
MKHNRRPTLSPPVPRLLLPACLALLGGCATQAPLGARSPVETLRAEISAPVASRTAVEQRPSPAPTASPVAAVPVARPELPPEPRFDLVVNGAAARDVFLALVADTRFSMLMHPEIAGTLSLTLRGVTVREALESVRDVYGFDFKIDGRRITVYPPTMQTRIFTMNYLNTKRQGRSDLRVSSGAAPANPAGGGSSVVGASSGATAPDSSQISTTSNADIWTETIDALRSIVGSGNGRNVIASAHAGTIAVRGMPEELRQVEAFLRASRMALERQVMLEAKIVEVELREGYQSGIDWSILRSRGAIGQTSGNTGNPLLDNNKGLPTLPAAVSNLLVDSVSLPSAGAGTLGLALATNGFQAVLGFLETHGDIQILSSPRVATMNNQKAVLKVGVDEYFVTNVSGGTTTAGSGNNSGTTTLPTLTLTPFFSGIALDVTPQIDDADTITLHIRPSVTSVTEKTKQIDLGSIGNYRLPLASSSVNETDTMVRVTDGRIVAIGGLMQMETNRSSSGVPGSNANAVTRNLLGNNANTSRKKELVVLIKPTIIRSNDDWQRTTDQALASIEAGSDVARRVITVNAASTPTSASTALAGTPSSSGRARLPTAGGT